MFSGFPSKGDIAARLVSTRSRGGGGVRAISISYVDGARTEHRGSSPSLAPCSHLALTRELSQPSIQVRSLVSPSGGTRQHRGCAAGLPRYRTRTGWWFA